MYAGLFMDEARRAAFTEFLECPVCHQPASAFYLYEQIERVRCRREKKHLWNIRRIMSAMTGAASYRKKSTKWLSVVKVFMPLWGTKLPMPG